MMLSVKQVAELLNISIFTIYRLARKGEIPSYGIGRCIRFAEDEILRYIRKGEVKK